ncbi:MAG: hypothetical protein K9G11_00245 [Rickettsiaceae bacterium]|nr:hypothetical protein [Rickettsiaceae bacterium]
MFLLFVLGWPEFLSVIVLCHHEPRAKRCERGDPVINFFLSIYVEESFILDCHGANASRNDTCALPLGDFAALILESLECLSVLGVCHHEP